MVKLNKKRQEKIKELRELYAEDTRIIIKIIPKNNGMEYIYDSEFTNKPIKIKDLKNFKIPEH